MENMDVIARKKATNISQVGDDDARLATVIAAGSDADIN